MKKLLLLLLASVIGFGLLAQPFEGTIRMIPDFKGTPDENRNAVIYLQGENMVMDFKNMTNGESKEVRMVGNRAANEYYMLMDMKGKKVAMKMNTGQMSGMSDPRMTGKAPDPKDKPDFEITNETRVIDGYTCKRVIGKSEDGITEAWITNEIDMNMGDLMFSPKSEASYGAYGGLNGMMLEGWTTDKKGKIKGSVKMVPEKKKLDPKMFEIGPEYQKVDMMQMMQMAQSDPAAMEEMMELFGGEE